MYVALSKIYLSSMRLCNHFLSYCIFKRLLCCGLEEMFCKTTFWIPTNLKINFRRFAALLLPYIQMNRNEKKALFMKIYLNDEHGFQCKCFILAFIIISKLYNTLHFVVANENHYLLFCLYRI